MKIEDLKLSVRVYNCLKRAGIDTVEQLCRMTDEELMKLRNFGVGCLNEVRRKIGAHRKTNADWIRGMTDEELAEFLADKYVMESCLRLKDEGCEPTETQKKVIKHTLYCTWIRWLRQTAQEGK